MHRAHYLYISPYCVISCQGSGPPLDLLSGFSSYCQHLSFIPILLTSQNNICNSYEAGNKVFLKKIGHLDLWVYIPNKIYIINKK